MKAGKKRADQLLVDVGLAESRSKAQALILAGSVLANEQKVQKPGQLIAPDAPLRLLDQLPYVSRGGLKLEAALRSFEIAVAGKVCIDIGASTGGFTDCLLQNGAARVYAVDVGSSQLDWRLRTDPSVRVLDHTNARFLRPADIPEACHLAVCDVSFISVTLILPVIPPVLTPDGAMVILVKPQFESGREQVGKGGIIRDPAVQAAACNKVQAAVEALGFQTAIIESPITGAEGNREFLLYAHKH